MTPVGHGGSEDPPVSAYHEALLRLVGSSVPGMRLGLDSTRALLLNLGDPQLGLPGVLVGGTNGKGSVCAMVAEMALAAGHRVVLLTKPHLTSYRERIRLRGVPIEEEFFAEVAHAVSDAADSLSRSHGFRPTHHELLTAMGFLAARRWGAEVVVCEVGLGGRLDATNVWDGGIAVICSVALDHQKQLGNTIAAIATEKAAIIKRGDLAVAGVPEEALAPVLAAAKRAPARLWLRGREIKLRDDPQEGLLVETPRALHHGLEVGLRGSFQQENAALAAAAVDGLQELGLAISEDAVHQGLSQVDLPGRMQRIEGPHQALVIVDAAHNPAAVGAVLPLLQGEASRRPAVLLFGSMTDHDHQGMLSLLERVPFGAAVFTRSGSARAAPTAELRQHWSGQAEVVEPVAPALERAKETAGAEGVVLALGSMYLIGEVMAQLGVGVTPDPAVPFPALW
ncbi:MAG: bifunctional folylpolyglutamate synthase/dihydrofolate synthase [Candidatus Dormibacteria bacterium]